MPRARPGMVRGRVRVRVRGGRDLFPHTHACKVGLSGMRLSEGGQRLGLGLGSGSGLGLDAEMPQA